MGLILVVAPQRTTVSARAVVVDDPAAVVVAAVGKFCTGQIALRGKNTIKNMTS